VLFTFAAVDSFRGSTCADYLLCHFGAVDTELAEGCDAICDRKVKLVLSRLRSGLSIHLGSLSFEGQGAFAT
jgi:hypothetical protein